MSLKEDFKQLFTPYYVFNLLMSVSFILLKRIPGVCNYLFHVDDCEFDGRETEILFFLLIVVMIRTRKSGSVTMINYLSSSFIYTKVANLILWFNSDLLMGIVYGIIFVFGALLFPEPTYTSDDNVIYFRGINDLTEELTKNSDVTWVVTFYTVWSPPCVNFAPIFSKLSNSYALSNLKFGKIDIGRYPEAALKYKVDDGSLSKQLPTVMLFKNGELSIRRPLVHSKGNITTKFFFNTENVVRALDLNNIYEQSKKTMKTHKNHQKKD